LARLRAVCIVVALLALTATLIGSCRDRGGSRPAKPDWVQGTSEVLGIAFNYDRNFFTRFTESKTAEFPVRLSSDRYELGAKKLFGIGALLLKEPGSDFFKYFSGETLHHFQDHYGMELTEQETVEDFTAQNRPGGVQFMHMKLPEDRSRLPLYVPTDVDEVYLYYFHYYFPPDYWYFAAISKQRLSENDIAYAVKFIEGVDFTWQPGEEPEEAQ